MTNLLSRMTQQATGHAKSGIRARTPSRFEGHDAGGHQGFHELSEDIPADTVPCQQAVQMDAPDSETLEQPSASRPDTPTQSPRTLATAPKPLLSPNKPDPNVTSESRQANTRNEATSPPAQSPSSARVPESPPTDLPAQANQIAHPASPVASHEPTTPSITVDDPLSSPPAPLLPPEPQAQVAMDLPQSPQPAAQPNQLSEPALATPPDVTIHIGRIELRSDAPKPARPKPPKAAPNVAALGDYLRGRSK